MKQQFLKSILVGAVIGGFPGASAWALSVAAPSEFSRSALSVAGMIDGAERDSTANFETRGATDDTAYVHDTDGSDSLVASSDDSTEGLSDNIGDGHKTNFSRFISFGYRHPELTPRDYIDWRLDADRDGQPDGYPWLEKRVRCDDPSSLTTVPLPGSLLLFGSSLLGLAATLRNARRT
ncbi:MAG: hypothetical protein ACYC9J_01525 [Sulfuricaulis sp.]